MQDTTNSKAHVEKLVRFFEQNIRQLKDAITPTFRLGTVTTKQTAGFSHDLRLPCLTYESGSMLYGERKIENTFLQKKSVLR